MDLQETRWDSVDWINLARDRDQWQTIVNMVMNSLKSPTKYSEFIQHTLVSQEEFNVMQSVRQTGGIIMAAIR
jgi:hypothetical protein